MNTATCDIQGETLCREFVSVMKPLLEDNPICKTRKSWVLNLGFTGQNVQFRKGANKWNGVEGIRNIHHYHAISVQFFTKTTFIVIDSLTNPFPVCATKAGEFCPPCKTASLKSSTAFPNHIRITRKLVKPVMNPSRPIQAVVRCTPGLSTAALSLAGSFARRAERVKRKKNRIVKAMPTAMKAGVVAVGAVTKLGAEVGSTLMSTVPM